MGKCHFPYRDPHSLHAAGRSPVDFLELSLELSPRKVCTFLQLSPEGWIDPQRGVREHVMTDTFIFVALAVGKLSFGKSHLPLFRNVFSGAPAWGWSQLDSEANNTPELEFACQEKLRWVYLYFCAPPQRWRTSRADSRWRRAPRPAACTARSPCATWSDPTRTCSTCRSRCSTCTPSGRGGAPRPPVPLPSELQRHVTTMTLKISIKQNWCKVWFSQRTLLVSWCRHPVLGSSDIRLVCNQTLKQLWAVCWSVFGPPPPTLWRRYAVIPTKRQKLSQGAICRAKLSLEIAAFSEGTCGCGLVAAKGVFLRLCLLNAGSNIAEECFSWRHKSVTRR